MLDSLSLFKEASTIIPGGVNSPVRAFKGVGGCPVFIERGEGAYLYDVEGNRYIDYVGSWGPLILGHAHPAVVEAVIQTAHKGLSFGAPTLLEIELAKKIQSHLPSIEKIRMVNSGTEATMTAIRLARGYTGKKKIIKFTGCYHGHSDGLLVKSGSGLMTLGIPASPGIPEEVTQNTLSLEFNDIQQVKMAFDQNPNGIAAIIIEPVAGNMGLVLPKKAYLQQLRNVCDEHQALLIFDEVMTGFRVAMGGAQAIYKVTPDLTTLGKIIGGGMPVGALGGKAQIMQHLAPEGEVYQAGTLSGNPLAMAAGLATLTELEKPGQFEKIEHLTSLLAHALHEIGQHSKVPFYATSIGAMFGFGFGSNHPIENHEQATQGDLKRFQKFYHEMLKQGVYLAPSMYEAGFVSLAHHKQDITQTIDAASKAFHA